ncbi:ribosome maturation factor RimP [Nocardia panacis]|uniref:Ribosome maturation factor RimP n=1 Tax=Nocardia panacis TaxID=2340916 RepID=A0A3A4KFR6_9NOCA|nr:ribosome maturation factor RimP [Nocardia panacis]RJO74778.1 ribosome maturation factor RimP [Nocardia panacis]
MPMPTEERVSQLVAELVERRGFDLEGVEISTAGTPARVKVVVDSDTGSNLDTVAELSTEMSLALDDAGDFGETPYLLEVTTPGIDRPLTADRHWRRAQGRKARIALREGVVAPDPGIEGAFEARIGALDGARITLVLPDRRAPRAIGVALDDIDRAVVQVEFNPPNAREMALAGGVAPGRPEPGQGAQSLDEEISESALSNETASDSTEGIVE